MFDMIQIELSILKEQRNFQEVQFKLSQLDGMGQAVLEQQQAEEMKERAKDYKLHQLAVKMIRM